MNQNDHSHPTKTKASDVAVMYLSKDKITEKHEKNYKPLKEELLEQEELKAKVAKIRRNYFGTISRANVNRKQEL